LEEFREEEHKSFESVSDECVEDEGEVETN